MHRVVQRLFALNGTIWNALRVALRIISGIAILDFAFVALCGALQTHFHRWGRYGKRQLQRHFLRKRGAAGIPGHHFIKQKSHRFCISASTMASYWSGRRGSNSLPPPWQGGALPDELRPHIRCIYPCTLPSDSCEFRGPRESLRSKILWGRGGISEFVAAVLLVRLPDKRLTFRRSDPDRARTDDPQRDRLVL